MTNKPRFELKNYLIIIKIPSCAMFLFLEKKNGVNLINFAIFWK
jgi:hypothetical protein